MQCTNIQYIICNYKIYIQYIIIYRLENNWNKLYKLFKHGEVLVRWEVIYSLGLHMLNCESAKSIVLVYILEYIWLMFEALHFGSVIRLNGGCNINFLCWIYANMLLGIGNHNKDINLKIIFGHMYGKMIY